MESGGHTSGPMVAHGEWEPHKWTLVVMIPTLNVNSGHAVASLPPSPSSASLDQNSLGVSSVQFTSGWYLCARKSLYALQLRF